MLAWGPPLARAGFRVEAERPFPIDLTTPLPAALRAGVAAACPVQPRRPAQRGDLAKLDTLLDSDGPAGIARRDDLTVRAVRTVRVGRRT